MSTLEAKRRAILKQRGVGRPDGTLVAPGGSFKAKMGRKGPPSFVFSRLIIGDRSRSIAIQGASRAGQRRDRADETRPARGREASTRRGAHGAGDIHSLRPPPPLALPG